MYNLSLHAQKEEGTIKEGSRGYVVLLLQELHAEHRWHGTIRAKVSVKKFTRILAVCLLLRDHNISQFLK